jgi:GH15 family glucan-1,4-alpha-glucosidase
MIEYDIASAKTEEDMKKINEKLLWIVNKALASGILSEQIHPYTGEQISVSPLTWSHAEYVLTVIAYLERLEELGICTVCYPV